MAHPKMRLLRRFLGIVHFFEAVRMVAVLAAVAVQQLVLHAADIAEFARGANPVQRVGARLGSLVVLETVGVEGLAAHVAVEHLVFFAAVRGADVAHRVDADGRALHDRIAVFPDLEQLVVGLHVPDHVVRVRVGERVARDHGLRAARARLARRGAALLVGGCAY